MSDRPTVWVQVLRREMVTTESVVSEKTVNYGQRQETTRVVKINTEPYVIFSCGHRRRGADFDSRGKDRKRVQCWECEKGPQPVKAGG